MKRVFILIVLLTAAAMVLAQTSRAAQQKPSQPATGQQPAAQQTPATPGQQPGTQAAPPVGHRPPQAKTQDEFKAFQEASAKTGPTDSEAAASDFATKFPQSELRELLYRKAMYEYQNQNNAEKAIDMGRKMIQLDPDNPEALVMVATFLSEKTRETDLDRDERLSEGTRDAQKALQTVDTNIMLPANIPPEQAEGIKKQMKSMAHGALGTISIAKKDYAAAENELRTATQLYPPDPLNWLRLAYSLDQQKKYQEALVPAGNCVQYSADQPQVNNLCKAERDRLTKLVSSPPAAQTPPTSPAPTSPQPTAVPPR